MKRERGEGGPADSSKSPHSDSFSPVHVLFPSVLSTRYGVPPDYVWRPAALHPVRAMPNAMTHRDTVFLSPGLMATSGTLRLARPS